MPQNSLDVDALYAALDKQRQDRGKSWRDVASDLEISASTFTRMAQGKRPDVDTFGTLVGWLGVSADRFLQTSTGDESQADPVVMISSYLRSAKNIEPEDAEALEDIIQAAYKNLTRKR